MAAAYDVPTYLLDRANIQETIVPTMHLFDTRATAETINSVYTPEIHLDYDQLPGFSLEVISYRNTLIDLPQPMGKNLTTHPNRCHVSAYAHGWFYNRDAERFPRLMVRRQGGKWKLELVRCKELEEEGESPWRINKQQVRLSWQDLPTQ
ncbi:hypothetical protein N7493_000937 [Penicillium malachiteum]|uniref:Uncharacterized protein n=1 Tax=Penicillium malachiteum TaxID=1324776 RepID=A0AAD6HXB7_9EURO|nr:hypothetical protein N7493_000937 [Penicillium malachiteum]